MSYAFRQLGQSPMIPRVAGRLAHGVSFGALVSDLDKMYITGSWSQQMPGEDMLVGKSATDFRPSNKPNAPTVSSWVAEQCAAGKHVWMTPPYGPGGNIPVTYMDLYSGAKPLEPGWKFNQVAPAFEPYACPEAGQPTQPGTPTKPGTPRPTGDKSHQGAIAIFGVMAAVATVGGIYLYSKKRGR